MSELLPPAAWIILTGALTASACALVGTFLVLRRMAMLGDAISHAVLPGIALAFLLSGSRSAPVMLLGAGILGVLTAFITQFLHKRGRLQEDAAIGVTFTWLFAIGVILISAYAGQIDLDQECVLYGEIAYVPWDVAVIGGRDYGPRAVWLLSAVGLLNLAFLVLGYKQLKICSFDPALAATIGINVTLWHYLLMGAVSLTTVAAFESVGAILVVAMLVGPAAAAYLLTDRLDRMLVLAVLIGIGSAVLGYYLAVWTDASIAGGMGVASGLLFGLALLFSPTHGLLLKRRALANAAAPVAACLLLLATAGAAHGDESKEGYTLFRPTPAGQLRDMSTDRPDVTESAYTVDAGHFQLEADLLSVTDRPGGQEGVRSWGVAVLNLKVGLTNRIDLQQVVETHLREEVEPAAGETLTESGIGHLTTRLKINLWGNDGGSTALALMPFVQWPTSRLEESLLGAGLIVPLAVELPNEWSLGTMLEVDWVGAEGEGRHGEIVHSITVSRGFGSVLGAFGELVSVTDLSNGAPAGASFDCGVTAGLNPDLQLDLGTNVGLTDSSDDWTAFLGVSVRR